MPKPVFIICSRSKSQDRFTNFLSLFEIVEGYTQHIAPIDAPPEWIAEQTQQEAGTIAEIRFFTIATWMRTEGDKADDKFEFEFMISNPGESEKTLNRGEFTFSEKPFHRLFMECRKLSPWLEPGICYVESRIRKVGTQEWLRQSYPIPVDVHKISPGDDN